MGHLTRTPTSNDPPRSATGKSQYLEENELMDEVALLLSGAAGRCSKCNRVVRKKYLESGLCPDCRE